MVVGLYDGNIAIYNLQVKDMICINIEQVCLCEAFQWGVKIVIWYAR